MIQRIRSFWRTSYQSDPFSFIVEMIGFMFVMIASLWLSFTADKPNMSYIYPAFFVANICSFISYSRRKLAWQLTTVIYFFFINLFGFGRAVGIW